LVKVLLNASRDFGYNAEFMASFGISGIDGTMKEKFTDPETRRRLRAKTGTLKGVNALAGYGVFPDSKAFAFAVIVNSQKEGTGIINYGDRIMRAVMELPVIKNK
jgi:D-alanyl-D-alanine carboxypeptidase/D-alanyl-D-alanine-endopeptidase (penicillin-binding protein 4)